MTQRRRPFAKFRASDAGSSAVEFALILPAFLMIVFGIVIFGSYLAVVHGVQAAVLWQPGDAVEDAARRLERPQGVPAAV